MVFAFCSFVITLGYAVLDGALAVLESSVWYGALATYYGLLALMRGGLLLNHRCGRKRGANKEELRRREAKAYRLCGILLILLTGLLSTAIVQMVRDNRLLSYAQLSVVTAALYAAVKIATSVANLFKAKKRENLTVQAIRCVSFAEALVSVLALQKVMIAALNGGGVDGSFFHSFVGAAVSVLVVGMGALMIRKGTLLLKGGTGDGDRVGGSRHFQRK